MIMMIIFLVICSTAYIGATSAIVRIILCRAICIFRRNNWCNSIFLCVCVYFTRITLRDGGVVMGKDAIPTKRTLYTNLFLIHVEMHAIGQAPLL